MAAPFIALVDDDLSVRRALLRLLRSSGSEAAAFSSAEELIEADVAGQADCLVVDIRLGGTSGFDLVERLRREGATAPVVFITAHDDAAAREAAKRLGASSYLRKPFEAVTFLDAVATAVESRAAAETEFHGTRRPRPP